MSGGRSWTTGEARRLREMRAKRLKATDIAHELGRTVDAIYSFLRYVPATPSQPACLKPTPHVSTNGRAMTCSSSATWRRLELQLKRLLMH
jgi:hypothetical protein